MAKLPGGNWDWERRTEVQQYRITYRGALAPRVILELFRRGIYRAWGGPTGLDTQRHRHHLRIQAETESEAIKQAHDVIEDSGGDASHTQLVVVGSD
jgi:hypothetical protein